MLTATLVSTTLAAVTFDVSRRCLRVQFRDGSCYQYASVPYGVFQALLTAESKGAFFNRVLRGNFSCIRLAQHLII
jgi:KTSC domain